MTQRVKLRAEAAQMHDGVRLYRGQIFTAPPEEAADLVALHFASVVDEQVLVPAAAEVQTKVQLPIKRGPGRPKKGVGDPPGKYRRRDLRAEN